MVRIKSFFIFEIPIPILNKSYQEKGVMLIISYFIGGGILIKNLSALSGRKISYIFPPLV